MTRPLLLFAPGAGAPSTSAWMRAWAERLAPLGDVVPFDYPYMKARVETGKRRPPDRLPALIAAHAAALAGARAGRRTVLLVGKSMGSRVGCHLSLEAAVDGLVCFGYPLVGMNGARRDEVLVALRTPVLFLQGTRDELCPLDLLAEVRTRMTAPSALHVVEDGDHDLATRKKVTGRPQAEVDADVLRAVAEFVDSKKSRDTESTERAEKSRK